jgi:hypothetical protein
VFRMGAINFPAVENYVRVAILIAPHGYFIVSIARVKKIEKDFSDVI